MNQGAFVAKCLYGIAYGVSQFSIGADGQSTRPGHSFKIN